MITADFQGTITSPPPAVTPTAASPSAAPASIAAATPSATPSATGDNHGFSFHSFLSALNPLQYLPGVGTIYRAATGDVIPEALRQAGSMVVSGLLGGPVGLVINLATTVAEKVTGFDPEKLVAAQFSSTPAAVTQAPTAKPAPAAFAPAAFAEAAAQDQAPMATQYALTPQQLAAYGVQTGPSGTLKLGDTEGADVLNGLQLARLGRTAAAAYAANQPTYAPASST